MILKFQNGIGYIFLYIKSYKAKFIVKEINLKRILFSYIFSLYFIFNCYESDKNMINFK